MRYLDATTFTDALAILAERQPEVLSKLDQLLSGPADANWLLAMLDRRLEAMSLIRRLINRAPQTLEGTTGFRRYQLIAAAHTATVYLSLFEALLGRLSEPLLQIETDEKPFLGRPVNIMLERLLRTEVPLPGQGELIESRITPKLRSMVEQCFECFEALASWRHARTPRSVRSIADHAEELYQAHYAQLAGHVPEFAMWVAFDRSNGRPAAHHRSLLELQARLTGAAPPPANPRGSHRNTLAQLNRGHLRHAILNANTM
ncbi:hypothetical protein AB0M46_41515 [Dactylosporangium sp. NPDC051485]|uniref:NACHT N-terminal helical domain 7-containing protein n=1 Tax=Dactylosporangium sp. NPDC051485 TaxID=3154846 RepID=UPI003429902A